MEHTTGYAYQWGIHPGLYPDPCPCPCRILCDKGIKYSNIRVCTQIHSCIHESAMNTSSLKSCTFLRSAICSCCCKMKCYSINCNKTWTEFSIPVCKSWQVVCAHVHVIYWLSGTINNYSGPKKVIFSVQHIFKLIIICCVQLRYMKMQTTSQPLCPFEALALTQHGTNSLPCSWSMPLTS